MSPTWTPVLLLLGMLVLGFALVGTKGDLIACTTENLAYQEEFVRLNYEFKKKIADILSLKHQRTRNEQ